MLYFISFSVKVGKGEGEMDGRGVMSSNTKSVLSQITVSSPTDSHLLNTRYPSTDSVITTPLRYQRVDPQSSPLPRRRTTVGRLPSRWRGKGSTSSGLGFWCGLFYTYIYENDSDKAFSLSFPSTRFVRQEYMFPLPLSSYTDDGRFLFILSLSFPSFTLLVF